MDTDMKYLKNYLKEYGIKLSTIRLKVLEFLLTSDIHPSADEIYKELVKTIPTLSKTSVYNTLYLFLEKNIIQSIRINGKEARYDINTDSHGHFKCNECGNIHDFDFPDEKIIKNILKGYKIESKKIYYYGICKKCNDKK